MNYTICYTSKSVKNLDNTEIKSIFQTTVQKNSDQGITGILLYNLGYFFQILEGDKEKVKSLFYDLIYPDERHVELFVVMEKFTKKPFFSSYSTEFSVVQTKEEYDHLKKYIDTHLISEDSKKFKRLLAPFIQIADL